VLSMGIGRGTAEGSWSSGWSLDVTGSYRLTFVRSIASSLGSCVMF
jgi:hypothetical protein